jgi:copper chaperone NosL
MTRRSRQSVGLSAAILVVGAGCGRSEPTGPPELRAGRDECAECGMLIYDERCAGAFLVEGAGGREHLLFDDVGCMLDRELDGQTEQKIVGRFVRDYSTAQWVGSDQATFLRSGNDRLRTPMGSGIVAFADRAGAERGVAEFGGQSTTYDALLDARREERARPSGGP